MRILFVSPYVPSPIRVRPYYWIKNLAALGHHISLFAITRGRDDEKALDEMRRVCARVTVARMPAWRPLWNCVRALPTRDPLQLAWSRLPELAREIRAHAEPSRADVAHVEHLRAACFAPELANLPIVYDAVDSISSLFEQTRVAGPRIADRWLAALDLPRTVRFEAGVSGRFDRVLVSSPVDAVRLHELAAGTARAWPVVLTNPVDLEYFRPTSGARDPATVIYSGKMSYHANVAAVRHLTKEVMPRVWRHRADVKVIVAGQEPDRSVCRLARDSRIAVTGFVPDLRPLLARATIAVCPLPYGAGVQNKVLEAMASGLPVVAGRRATQALQAEPGRDLRVADSPDDFANEILALLGAPAERERLAVCGRAYVEAHHDGLTLARRLAGVYDEVASGGRSVRSVPTPPSRASGPER